MNPLGRIFQPILFALLVACLVQCSVALGEDRQVPIEADNGGRVKSHPELPVLAYVTPWHPRGKQLVEDYRDKFDIVSPVWYTVHPSEDESKVYEVRGGPPSDEDKDWYQRLQKGSPSGGRRLQVAPRFILDGWVQEDYRQLMFNETRWRRLSIAITNVVEDMAFDGIVFESGITHALTKSLEILSDLLRDEDRILVLVMAPIRTTAGMADDQALASHNAAILQSVYSLHELADYFSIMTYDMTGPGGHASLQQFPPNSQLHAAQLQHKVRVPGPNTNSDWIRTNLVAFTDAAQNKFNDQQYQFSADISAKFLMGLPLYGYKYPVLLASANTGTIVQSDNTIDSFAILRGPGEAILMSQIDDLITNHGPEIQMLDDGEFYFDYKVEDGLWRVFLPAAQSMSKILNLLSEGEYVELGAGVALWEIGQSSADLLATL